MGASTGVPGPLLKREQQRVDSTDYINTRTVIIIITTMTIMMVTMLMSTMMTLHIGSVHVPASGQMSAQAQRQDEDEDDEYYVCRRMFCHGEERTGRNLFIIIPARRKGCHPWSRRVAPEHLETPGLVKCY